MGSDDMGALPVSAGGRHDSSSADPDRRFRPAGHAVAAPAADEVEQVVNGGFDTTTDPWWSTAGVPMTLDDGRVCVDVPGGTGNPWDAVIGQNDIALVAGETYRFSFTASGDPDGQRPGDRRAVGRAVRHLLRASPALTARAQLLVHLHRAGQHRAGQVAFQVGGSADAVHASASTTSRCSAASAGAAYVPDTGPRVRVNQVGYLPDGPEERHAGHRGHRPRCRWQLQNAGGTVVASGTTTPRGVDAASGQNVHTHRLRRATARRGTGYTLVADGETSHPFDISGDRLRAAALGRAAVLLHPAQRHRDRRRAGRRAVRPPGRPRRRRAQPGRHRRALPARRLRLPAGRRAAAGTTRATTASTSSTAASPPAQLLSTFERTKTAPTAARRGARRRHAARARARQRRAGHPRRGPLGAGVPAAHAGAGRQAARRHGAPQDARRQLDRPAAAARRTTRSRASCTRRRRRRR